MKKIEINQALLHNLFFYDKETGLFTRKIKTCPSVKVGDIAGSKSKNGYWFISFNVSQKYLAHRLAWMYVYGKFPDSQLDHINGIRSDNRLCNLREANNAENNRSTTIRRTNTSGVKGVYKHSQNGNFVAQITVNYKRISLGSYANIIDAGLAYEAAAQKYFGEFYMPQQL